MKTCTTIIPGATNIVKTQSSARGVEEKQRRLAELGRVLLEIAAKNTAAKANGGAQ